MIRQQFTLPKYGWRCFVYYVVTKLDADEIIDRLMQIGCDGDALERAYRNLTSGKCDTGLTYSNTSSHETVMVIAKTTNAKEFAQSWRHEMGHTADHIALCHDIDPHGEELQYIGDALIEKMWPVSHKLLCDCCRAQERRKYREY